MKRITAVPTGTPDSTRLAESLLKTMEQGDLTRLETEIDRVQGVWLHRAAFASHNSEQLDLLSAVACDLRQSVSRMQKQRTRRLEGAPVHLYLLRHLARRPS